MSLAFQTKRMPKRNEWCNRLCLELNIEKLQENSEHFLIMLLVTWSSKTGICIEAVTLSFKLQFAPTTTTFIWAIADLTFQFLRLLLFACDDLNKLSFHIPIEGNQTTKTQKILIVRGTTEVNLRKTKDLGTLNYENRKNTNRTLAVNLQKTND